MSINDPLPRSLAQQPRGLVLANGERAAGLVSFEVDNNSFYQADTFRAVLALSAQPRDRGADWWSRQDKIEAELLAGFPADPQAFGKADLVSLMVGYADDIEIDPLADEIILAGRDLTSVFIDTKTAEKYLNRRASEIAQELAQSHGLEAEIVATPGIAGAHHHIDAGVTHHHNRSEWDLLTALADREGYQVYVTGRTLHFEPRTDPNDTPYVIRWQAPDAGRAYPVTNALSLRLSRSLSIAKDIRVIVLSHHPKYKKQIVATAERKRVRNKVTRGVASETEPPQTYTYNMANLTPEQAQRYANERARAISQHEMNLHARLPGDSLLTARTLVRLEGTDSAFDQTYWPSSIIRHYSLEEGYSMELSAKNHSTESTVPG